MSGRLPRSRLVAIASAGASLASVIALAAGILVASAAPANAVTCPSVNQLTGAVTPAPSPGVDWQGCDLAVANFVNADLSGANLTDATLTSSTFAGANLAGTEMSGATMLGVHSGGVTGMPASLPGNWNLISGYLVGPEANLDAAGLQGTDLAGADLFDARLVAADVAGADLAGVDLTGADLVGVQSGGITGTPASLPSEWQLIGGYLIGAETDLSGDNLSGLDLAKTNLELARLVGTDLAGANLDGAQLADAVLTNADLAGASLTGAGLNYVVSGGIAGTPASLPLNWALVGGYLIGQTAILVSASLADANLSGTDLAFADLAEANLSHADLSSANLNYANLLDADLAGANLTDTSLAGVRSGGITGTPASLPADWLLVKGNLVGPGADLLDAALSGAGLAGADLAGADMADAILSNANLTGAGLAAANLSYADASGANLTRADLKGATVSGANFADVVWQGTTCPDGLNSNDYVDGCFSERLYGLAGFIAPKPASRVSRSARHIVVRFRLTNAAGHRLGTGIAAALAAQHRVKAVLTGSGAGAGALCRWDRKTAYFSCAIKTPRTVKTGHRHRYVITAMENLGRVFAAAPADHGAANPEVIYFR